jgi:chemotaxis protein methyltransferase CheR
MNAPEFDFIANLLKQKSGLALGRDKSYLLETRLSPIAARAKVASVEELIRGLRQGRHANLVADITSAMTTNESSFFRDGRPFETFRTEILPRLLERRDKTRTIRIWCAAASTGQEPYTLAMLLKEEKALLGSHRIEIVGTDIAPEVLARAKEGIYSHFEVQRGLPARLLVKYFDKVGDQWQIKPELRQMVQYREFNLLNDLKPLGRFDIIFCRNVLIYFDQATKANVLGAMNGVIADDGVLFLGGAETVLGISDKFKLVAGQRGVYSPVFSASAPRVAMPPHLVTTLPSAVSKTSPVASNSALLRVAAGR